MIVRVQLTRRFQDFELNATFQTASQGITAIFGPSGSGKTTLLRAIAGLDSESAGQVLVGTEVWQDSSTFLPPHRRGAGFLFQESNLFPHLTVAGNLAYGHKRRGQNAAVNEKTLIDLLELKPLLHRRPHTLSGGERRRVALARALWANPKLLLLDEPFSGLHEAIKQDIYGYLETLRQQLGIPMLLVTHDLAEVSRLADSLVLLNDGAVCAAGPLTETLTRLDLPLVQSDGASAVLYGQVQDIDERWGLASVRVGDDLLRLPMTGPLQTDQPLRLRIAARDVSLACSKAQDSSILNILPARVDALDEKAHPLVTVRLQLGNGQPLLSRITARSWQDLSLNPGDPVFVQIKSAAVLT